MAKEDRVFDNLTTQEEKELKPKPVGSNSLGSYAIYQQRSYYKNQVYPTQIIPTPVDFWYDKNKSFYGRVDTRGNAIIPDSSFMSKITTIKWPEKIYFHLIYLLLKYLL